MLPRLLNIGALKVIDRELQLLLQPDLAILYWPFIRANHPRDVVDAVHVLEKSRYTLQAIGQLNGDGIQVKATALLEVSELRDLQPIKHHLPADAPGAQGRRLPVVFFELDVVFAQINAQRGQRVQIQLLHVLRWRLQDHLVLHVLEQPVRVLAVTAIGRATRRLHVANVVRLGAEYSQERLGRHGSCADFDVIGLLQDAPVLRPESLQAENQLLKGQRILRGSQMVFLIQRYWNGLQPDYFALKGHGFSRAMNHRIKAGL